MRPAVRYTTTPLDLAPDEVVFVVARPIYGRHIGYDGGSGFKVMAVDSTNEAHMDEARRMDAQPVEVVEPIYELDLLATNEYAEAYQELIDAGDLTLRGVLADMGYRHTEVTPVT